jgi:hypothetical protein
MPNPKALVITDIQVITLNLNNARTFGPLAVPADVTTISVEMTTDQWNVGTVFTVRLEVSVDGGVTFPPELRTPDDTFQPPFVGKDGQPMSLFLGWSIPEQTNPNRVIRVVTNTANGPLHTTAKVQTQTF